MRLLLNRQKFLTCETHFPEDLHEEPSPDVLTLVHGDHDPCWLEAHGFTRGRARLKRWVVHVP